MRWETRVLQFLLEVHKNIFAVTKPGAGIYVFHADTEGINFRRAMKKAGFKIRPMLRMGEADPSHGPPGLPLATRARPIRLEAR